MERRRPTSPGGRISSTARYHPKDEVYIAIVGKYVEYEDSYKSLKEALIHGALSQNLKLRVTWIEAEGLEVEDARRPQLRSTT